AEQGPIGVTVDQLQPDGLMTPQSTSDQRLRVATTIDGNRSSGACRSWLKNRQTAQLTSRRQVLQQIDALSRLDLAAQPAPVQQLRNRARQFVQTQIRKIGCQLSDQVNVLRRQLPATKDNLGIGHMHDAV